MIVDAPITYDLTIGNDRRIPQGGDAQLLVPPVITPVALSLVPTIVLESSVAPKRTSFITESLITRTNQASFSQVVATLALGLWELEFTLSTWFNYSNVAGTFNRVSILGDYQGFQVALLARFALINQSFTDFQRMRVLVTEDFIIRHSVPLTGVGQSLDTIMTINAIRVL